MQLQNRNRVAYLGALTLLFSYAEMLIPRIIPFFRIGFGNIIILLALPLNISSFVSLTLIKSVASCLVAGTLFSPFFLISISQSFTSGIIMFLLFRIRKNWLSIYGISLAGSASSAIIQILLSSLYIGAGTFALLGPMMIFSIFSGIVTAYFSQALNIPEYAPELIRNYKNQNESTVQKILLLVLILISLIITFMISRIHVLAVCLVFGFILEMIMGRKIKILPHVFLWIFILISNLFIPSGKVIFELGFITITSGALFSGIEKALKLSVAMTLSQCCFKISFSKESIISLVLAYFNGLLTILNETSGNLFIKLKATLNAKVLKEN